jgi:hypothetical protein
MKKLIVLCLFATSVSSFAANMREGQYSSPGLGQDSLSPYCPFNGNDIPKSDSSVFKIESTTQSAEVSTEINLGE